MDEAPRITSFDSATFAVSAPGNFVVTTAGDPISAISITGALPAGVTFTDNLSGTATLSGIPAAGTSGTYPITITADNGVGMDATQEFVLTVEAASAADRRARHRLRRG